MQIVDTWCSQLLLVASSTVQDNFLKKLIIVGLNFKLGIYIYIWLDYVSSG